jgi:ABC-type Fe3+ transport system substrate-binding protein
MRSAWSTVGAVLATVLVMVSTGLAAERPAPPRFGQTYDQIVAMAKKEGRVRFATALMGIARRFDTTFGAKFKEKYGIDIDYEFTQGVESRERILLELKAGRVNYDAVQIIPEVIPAYFRAGVVDGPFDWQGLFGVEPMYISPDKYMITAGSTVFCFAYNPDLLPANRVPRKWEDVLDPYYKGKFVVVTRPQAFIGLYPHWGKQKTLDYAKALAANNPIWMSSFDATLAGVAAGEFPMLVGANTTDVMNFVERDPTAKLKMALPTEVPVNAWFHTVILKGSKSPNAGLLLAGWLASPEGQKMFDTIVHRGHPMVEGTEISRILKASGAKVYLNNWEFTAEMAERTSREVIEAWGFPTPRKQ